MSTVVGERARSKFVLAYGWLGSIVGWAAFVGWDLAEHGDWPLQVLAAAMFMIMFELWRRVLGHYRWLAQRGQLGRVYPVEWVGLMVSLVTLALAWTAA